MAKSGGTTRWAAWLCEKHLVWVFQTTHETMAVEALLKDVRIWTKLTPKPRVAREDCALALVLQVEDGERAERMLTQADLRPQSAWTLGKDGTWNPRKWSSDPPSTASPPSAST
jgi:hypothetical protein